MSVFAKLKALDKQREKLLAGAKKEAFQKAQEAVAELNALGFNYSLSEGKGRGRKKGVKFVKSAQAAQCPVCNFKTKPHHDARKHRGQGNKKRPFNGSELAKLGLQRV